MRSVSRRNVHPIAGLAVRPPAGNTRRVTDLKPTPRSHRMNAEARLAELKLELPPAPKPVAVYKPLVIAGNLAYVSGHGPLRSDKTLITGRVGADLDLAAGKAAARQVGLAILATLRAQLGSLDKVKRVVKVLGMVNSAPNFLEHPAVINGCSELFADVWGPENGIGARSAVGMGPLPGNIAVEIEAIFELSET
jgi:enamine deaminase RidA (YjgF/YER057c/UK114 family)